MNPPDKAIIRVVLSSSPTREAVRTVIAFFHQAATVYLRHKQATGGLRTSQMGLSIDDLAIDCISDLFERDENGHFVILIRYLERIGWDQLSEQDLQGVLRRLVFSHVNQEIYRSYKEVDPTLHRIIRNIKESTQSVPGILLASRAGESWVSFAEELAEHDLPTAPPEYLGPHVQMFVAQGLETPALLHALRQIMLQQNDYRPGYPIIRLALLIREAYAALAENRLNECAEASDVDVKFQREDFDQLLRDTITSVGQRMRHSHVARGKLTTELLTMYLSVAYNVLRQEYLDSSDEQSSYFAQMKQWLPDLTQSEYRENHRSLIEYLVKLVRAAFLKAIREDL